MKPGVTKEYVKHLTKKKISDKLFKELSVKFDKKIEELYPSLPKFDNEKIQQLKIQYDKGDKSVLEECELMMLSKAFGILKDFYIRYDINNFDFEDALSEIYLINKQVAVHSFKTYNASWFNYYYLKYYFNAKFEKYIIFLMAKYNISNADVMQTYIDREIKLLDELEAEYTGTSPDDAVIYEDFKLCLDEVISTLTAREQAVIRKSFGLDDGIDLNLAEVGNQYNVSRERIRQILSKALRKMRHPYRTRKLEDFTQISKID